MRNPLISIVASLRDWRTVERLAGCDVFTIPCPVLGELLRQTDLPARDVRTKLGGSISYSVSERVAQRLGAERIERLTRVEPELLEFLRDIARVRFEPQDGDVLFKRFDAAEQVAVALAVQDVNQDSKLKSKADFESEMKRLLA